MATSEPAALGDTLNADPTPFLERVDDAAIVQLEAGGFEELPREARILCFHLANAALAARDVFLDQKYAHALEMRDYLEELYVHREALTEAARAEVERYTKLFWINNGPHHHESGCKEPFRLTRRELEVALEAAESHGARYPWRTRGGRRQALAWLFDTALDATVDPICTNKNPGPGRDPLVESCVNFYRGVRSEDLTWFEESYPLNSTLVKRDSGELVEEVWRCGDGASIPPGLYARELAASVRHLRRALPFAPEPTRRALETLIRFYQTGDPADLRRHHVAWVEDTDSPVDTVQGFVEVYLDPRGRKGSYEGIVFYGHRGKTAAIRAIAEHAAWFEERMPWDNKYKKLDVRSVTARAIDVVLETGDAGPITPIGINLPNPQDVRELHGSKSVNLANVGEALERTQWPALRREFCLTEEELDRAVRWAFLVNDVHTNMHEAIGHASGRLAPHVTDPAAALRETYSTLEEARADLVALWFLPDPGAIERGLSPGMEAALAGIEGYTRGALLSQLRRVKTGDRLEEDHARNRQLVASWILVNSEAIARVRRDGKTYFVVKSLTEWRAAAGRLLAEIMRIKAEGDYGAARALVEAYGVRIDTELRDEVVARVRSIDPPSYTAFVQPRLAPVFGRDGQVLDVRIEYLRSLASQMLEWSGRSPRRVGGGPPP